MTTKIIQAKEAALTNQLNGIMQDIADLVETHPWPSGPHVNTSSTRPSI